MRIEPKYAELAEIFQRYRIKRVSVFGSWARGDATAESDYDFLVGFAPKASLLDLGGLYEDLSEHYGCAVDIVSERVIQKEKDDFAANVLRDARVIYETDIWI